ncbi:MAG: hypothetical protein KDB27_07865 [Planctomycetales bacterium]|nr:hypothetical protein [Planctomycetales bacterium]
MGKLVTIASYPDSSLAEAVRGQLEANGFRAIVTNAVVSHMLSHVRNAIGGAKIQVFEEDAQAAFDFLARLEAESGDSSELWRCQDCQEVIEGQFEICWACGKERSEVEDPNFVIPTAEIDPPESKVDVLEYSGLRAPLDLENPYSPPGETMLARTNRSLIPGIEESEYLIERAWKASLIGILFPPFFQIYSMYLLLRASVTRTPFSQKAQRRFYIALILNIAVVALTLVAFGPFFL